MKARTDERAEKWPCMSEKRGEIHRRGSGVSETKHLLDLWPGLVGATGNQYSKYLKGQHSTWNWVSGRWFANIYISLPSGGPVYCSKQFEALSGVVVEAGTRPLPGRCRARRRTVDALTRWRWRFGHAFNHSRTCGTWQEMPVDGGSSECLLAHQLYRNGHKPRSIWFCAQVGTTVRFCRVILWSRRAW